MSPTSSLRNLNFDKKRCQTKYQPKERQKQSYYTQSYYWQHLDNCAVGGGRAPILQNNMYNIYVITNIYTYNKCLLSIYCGQGRHKDKLWDDTGMAKTISAFIEFRIQAWSIYIKIMRLWYLSIYHIKIKLLRAFFWRKKNELCYLLKHSYFNDNVY